MARADETALASAASALIASAAGDNDIATREDSWLAEKIAHGKAAIALENGELVGFGYWSAWQDGAFVSHSGLVVRADQRGKGLGKRLKQVMMASSDAALPEAKAMSLTTSPQVKALNLALGFRMATFDELTSDEAFWAGCQTCRNYNDVQARGERCCCEAMLRDTPTPPTESTP